MDNTSVGRGDAVGTVRALLARNPVLTAFDPERTMLAFWAGWTEDAGGRTALHMLNIILTTEGVDDVRRELLLDEVSLRDRSDGDAVERARHRAAV